MSAVIITYTGGLNKVQAAGVTFTRDAKTEVTKEVADKLKNLAEFKQSQAPKLAKEIKDE